MAESWFQKAWAFIGHVGNIQTLLSLFAASGVSSWVISLLPGGWHQPQYWAVFGLTFFGTWLAVAAAAVMIQGLERSVNRLLRPPKLTVTLEGGLKGSVTLRHRGSSTEYSADARIVSTLNGSPNPAPQLFECEILKSDVGAKSVHLADGEWAQIVLASVPMNEFHGNTWLAIRRGGYGSDLRVTDAGVLIEVVIKASPAVKQRATAIRVRVTRGPDRIVVLTEVDPVAA